VKPLGVSNCHFLDVQIFGSLREITSASTLTFGVEQHSRNIADRYKQHHRGLQFAL
jgi:hypothetical protein